MFTGIVETVGEVRHRAPGELEIAAPFSSELRRGESVAVSGVCLTVVRATSGLFRAYVMPETLRCTSLGNLLAGDQVNLERALAVGDRFGGHVVTGHVDATGTVTSVRNDGTARRVTITASHPLLSLTAAKGSVAVDGISLTVVDVFDDSFTVSLIPHTLEVTTAGLWQPGSVVNLEADVLARYVQRSLAGLRARELSEVS